MLAIAGAGVGLLGWAAGSEALERWGIVSLLLAGAFAVPSYATGIAAADLVSERTFVRPSVIQTHRTWATWAAVGLVTAGMFAGFSLAQPRDARLRRFVLLVGAGAAALTGWAASRGGRIAHPEETGAPAAGATAVASGTHPAAIATDASASAPPRGTGDGGGRDEAARRGDDDEER